MGKLIFAAIVFAVGLALYNVLKRPGLVPAPLVTRCSP